MCFPYWSYATQTSGSKIRSHLLGKGPEEQDHLPSVLRDVTSQRALLMPEKKVAAKQHSSVTMEPWAWLRHCYLFWFFSFYLFLGNTACLLLRSQGKTTNPVGMNSHLYYEKKLFLQLSKAQRKYLESEIFPGDSCAKSSPQYGGIRSRERKVPEFGPKAINRTTSHGLGNILVVQHTTPWGARMNVTPNTEANDECS